MANFYSFIGSMSKQRLFELIRREEVVLWIGAGFSKYAGYPIGNTLADKILSLCTSDELDAVAKNTNLQDISSNFVSFRGGSRNQLLETLRQIFIDTKPTTTEYHNKLAQIPHIKTVITTNYDTLLEEAYRERARKVVVDADVAYVRNEMTSIIKIHGDFSHLDSIVITKEDYTKFYNTDYNTPIWHLLKERLVTKNIVFLGYGLEDSNINAILDKIEHSLGRNRKEAFFIAPNLPSLKQNELVRKGVTYINATGEEFIELLIQDIDSNILHDIQRKIVSVDTANKYIELKNIYLGLKPHHQGYLCKSSA